MEVLEVGYGPTTRDFDYSFNFLNLQVDSQMEVFDYASQAG